MRKPCLVADFYPSTHRLPFLSVSFLPLAATCSSVSCSLSGPAGDEQEQRDRGAERGARPGDPATGARQGHNIIIRARASIGPSTSLDVCARMPAMELSSLFA